MSEFGIIYNIVRIFYGSTNICFNYSFIVSEFVSTLFHCFRVCFNHSFIVSEFVSALFDCFRVCFIHSFIVSGFVSILFHCFSGWQEGKQSASVTGHSCRNGKTRTATTPSLTTCGKTNAFPKRRT